MASPTKINYGFSFTDYQINTPGEPLPGDEVDAAFNEVKRASDETIDRLNMIQRDDGELANQSVGVDQLKNDTFTVYQNYVSQAEAARDTAVSAAGSAETAKNAAEDARDVAISARNTATAAANTALNAKSDAEDARDTATAAAGTATGAANTALNAKNDAEDARDTAAAAAGSATSAKNAAESARDTAVGAAGTATAAAGTATSAANTAVSAKNDAEDARDTAVAAVANMSGGLSGQFLVKISNDDYDYGWTNLPGGGDMIAAVYDPQAIGSDAFARANHTGTQAISTVDGLQNALDAKQDMAEKGAANGYAGLDSAGKVPTSQLPAAVLGSVSYQGPWNAATNTPTIPAASSANKGHYYVVTTAGSTTVDGENDWKVKDWIISDGASWSKVDNTESVISVAGKTGAITLSIGDIANLQANLDAKVGLTGTQQINGHKRFTSNLTSIAQTTGTGTLLEAFSTSANAAGIAFHRSGVFAGYFGVDTDNKLKWGGWSMGANAYEIYHEGNFDPSNYLPLAGGTMAPGAVIQFANETAVKLFFYNNGASRYGASVESGATVLFGGTAFRFRGGNEVGTVYGELTSAGFKLAASAATPTDPLHAAPKQYVDGRTTISSQAQAEAGADNTTMMTPLRTAQAIAARSPVGLYTGSNQDETVFPLGHIVSAVGGVDPARNQTGEVRIATSINLDYTIGGSGDLLAGTWRARGRVATGNKIMQRVA